METLYEKYKHKGFIVLAFPSNQFNNQEPLSGAELKETYLRDYNVSYPIFEKTDVNGKDEHELYTFLKKERNGLLFPNIKWNYTKFLIDRDGHVVERYSPQTSPKDIEEDLRELL